MRVVAGLGTVDEYHRGTNRAVAQQGKVLFEAKVGSKGDRRAIRGSQMERFARLNLPPEVLSGGAEFTGVDIDSPHFRAGKSILQ